MKILITKIFNRIYLFVEKYLKLQIIRANYSSPAPVLSDLTSGIYEKELPYNGINFDIDSQKNLIDHFCKEYFHEFLPEVNTGLSLVDSFILYSFIRNEKPRKIVEIGHGDTTNIILNAIRKNSAQKCDFYFIDPFIRRKNLLKKKEIIGFEKKVQEVPIKFFNDVDFLFIDSSHISKIGSDVNFLMFEVIPSLRSNTIIHWHDIYIPYNYPKSLIENIRRDSMYNESYVVQSFISYNNKFKILYSGKFLQNKVSEYLKKRFSYYLPKHHLTSFYIKKK